MTNVATLLKCSSWAQSCTNHSRQC